MIHGFPNMRIDRMKKIAISVVMVCLLGSLAAADVWEDLATYKYGAKDNTADAAWKKLAETPAGQLGPIEAKLIKVISDADATQDGKACACRMLQRIGTDKSIPALTGLLDDKVLSHYARLALERMEDSAKAAGALRGVLDRTPDKLKVGILGSLGRRRDAQTVPQAQKLTGSKDAAVAAAALMALGRIANQDAANALAGLKVGGELTQAHMDALIVCAGRLGGPGAVPLYSKVLTGKSSAHHVAAMQGLAAVDPKAGAAAIADALQGDDPKMRQGALGAVVGVEGVQLTKAVTAILDDLSGDPKAELIAALGSRGDKTARDAVTRHLTSKHPAVRDAAIAASGSLGDAKTVKMLLDLAASGEAGDQVRQALTRMQTPGTDDALLRALSDRGSTVLAIQVLAARDCTTAAPRLLELIGDRRAEIRKEAWSGLGTLGSERDMKAVMDAVLKIEDSKELGHAQEAVKRIFSAASDRNACFAVVAGYYETAPDPVKVGVLGLGATAANPAALNLEREALKSGNKDLRKAAIRALASWPNTTAADDLLGLATSAKEEVDRILALRGYIGMAGSDQVKMSAGDRMKMFGKADGLVKRAEEKKLIISGLQRTKNAKGLGMLMEYVDDPQVKREAEMAAANLLWETRKRQSAEGKKIAERLVKSENKAVRDKAGSVLKEWNKGKDKGKDKGKGKPKKK